MCRCGVPSNVPFRKSRLIFLVVVNVINWSALIYGVTSGFTDVGTFFLGITVVNFFAYFVYYKISKLMNGEKFGWNTMLYFVLTIGFWIPALHFFTISITNWDQPTATSKGEAAALSRNANADCIIFDFFDTHDLWHMLSAFALFFGALMMLTLDDNLLQKKRSEITVH